MRIIIRTNAPIAQPTATGLDIEDLVLESASPGSTVLEVFSLLVDVGVLVTGVREGAREVSVGRDEGVVDGRDDEEDKDKTG